MADSLIYTSEKTLSDAGDKADSNLKSDVEAKIKALKEVKDTDKLEEIKTQTESLSKTLQELGAKMYQQAPGQDTAGQSSAEEKQEEPKTENPEEKKEEENK